MGVFLRNSDVDQSEKYAETVSTALLSLVIQPVWQAEKHPTEELSQSVTCQQ